MRILRHLVMLLPLFSAAAFADSTGWFFGNTGGTMTFDPNTGTLTLTSTITKIVGVGIVETGANLGTITVTTGPLISGTLFHNALFDGANITLTVTAGISTSSGTLTPFTLTGTLRSPLTWWVGKSGDHLAGFGSGVINGVGSVTIWDFRQLAVLTGTNQYEIIHGGTTIPEPASVVLIVTGLGFIASRAKSRLRIQR